MQEEATIIRRNNSGDRGEASNPKIIVAIVKIIAYGDCRSFKGRSCPHFVQNENSGWTSAPHLIHFTVFPHFMAYTLSSG
jgi:hypothetical protein